MIRDIKSDLVGDDLMAQRAYTLRVINMIYGVLRLVALRRLERAAPLAVLSAHGIAMVRTMRRTYFSVRSGILESFTTQHRVIRRCHTRIKVAA